MIATEAPDPDAPSARSLPRLFSNYTRCTTCQKSGGIRVHYCPGCSEVSGSHFHRECPCGASWLERSAGHASVDLTLDDPRYVLICQHCRTRVPIAQSMRPQCCRRPEASYHDTREPCELCRSHA